MSFVEIKSKKQFIEELNAHKDQEIVIHYICPECDDEQVTYPFEVYEEEIEEIQNQLDSGSLFVDLDCTRETCGERIKFIPADYITGIEEDLD